MTDEAAHDRTEESASVTVAELDRDWPVWEARLHHYAERQLYYHNVPPGRLDADDVVQLTWLVLHTTKEPIRWADRYAYTVARRMIVKAAREGNRFVVPATTVAEDASELMDERMIGCDRGSPVEHLVLRQETLAEIIVAKRQLTFSQLAAVEGTIEQHLPRAAVAASIGVAPGTLSAHRARGLLNLRMALVGLVENAVPWAIAIVVGVGLVCLAAMSAGSNGDLWAADGSGLVSLVIGIVHRLQKVIRRWTRGEVPTAPSDQGYPPSQRGYSS